jgi:hypothetical protein
MVNPLPLPVIVLSSNVFNVNGVFSTYQWYLNGNTITGATSATYTATSSGNYTVKVTSLGGCEGISAPVNYTVSPPLSLNEINKYNLLVIISPNPAKNILTVSFPEKHNIDGEIFIVDAIGRNLRKVGFTSSHASLDVSSLISGNYVLKVVCANGIFNSIINISH